MNKENDNISELESVTNSDKVELGSTAVEELTLEQLQQKHRELQSELLAAESKVAANWDLLLRSRAEEENLKRRARLDLESAHKYAIEKFARSMLNVADSLEMGLNSAKTYDQAETDINGLREGVELTLKLFLNTLEDFGVKVLDPLGEQFNPIQHEAIAINSEEGKASNTVLKVLQKGFMIHERILRPARVIVAK